ncbi:MAG: arginine repressor [Candidatus Marinimicrobia bacterium]|nr:arginine repressor [Candidatus Neomarinimicrobiota bacterium]
MIKTKRQQEIKKIISQNIILEQSKIVELLMKAGIQTTQATVSRDLQEMSVIKIPLESGDYQYQLLTTKSGKIVKNKLQILFDNFVDKIIRTENQIIIKTTSGNANGIANYIDRLEIEGILGTIAGDDTILIITKNEKQSKKIEKQLNEIIEK